MSLNSTFLVLGGAKQNLIIFNRPALTAANIKDVADIPADASAVIVAEVLATLDKVNAGDKSVVVSTEVHDYAMRANALSNLNKTA